MAESISDKALSAYTQPGGMLMSTMSTEQLRVRETGIV